ncbi:MAG: hypothetical protein IKZ16_05010 [Clostridia bacterium]|nr:hypothetical protein [Clostridia bacterium]
MKMSKKTAKILLNIFLWVLCLGCLAFFLLGLYEEIAGAQLLADLLQALHVPFGVSAMYLIGFACAAAFIALQIVYNKKFRE